MDLFLLLIDQARQDDVEQKCADGQEDGRREVAAEPQIAGELGPAQFAAVVAEAGGAGAEPDADAESLPGLGVLGLGGGGEQERQGEGEDAKGAVHVVPP